MAPTRAPRNRRFSLVIEAESPSEKSTDESADDPSRIVTMNRRVFTRHHELGQELDHEAKHRSSRMHWIALLRIRTREQGPRHKPGRHAAAERKLQLAPREETMEKREPGKGTAQPIRCCGGRSRRETIGRQSRRRVTTGRAGDPTAVDRAGARRARPAAPRRNPPAGWRS